MTLLKFDDNDIVSSPFPHALKNNLLDSALYESLKQEFPSKKYFLTDSTFHGGRLDLRENNPAFDQFMGQSKVWQEFYHDVNSDAFMKYYFELLERRIDEYDGQIDVHSGEFHHYTSYQQPSIPERVCRRLHLQKIYQRLVALRYQNKFYVDFTFHKGLDGYWREIHTDNRHKFFVILVYFNSLEGGQGDIVLHEHLEKKTMRNYERFPQEKDVKEAGRLTPTDNCGIFALNCNNAYHSVPPLQVGDSCRNFIYVSVNAHENIWPGQE